MTCKEAYYGVKKVFIAQVLATAAAAAAVGAAVFEANLSQTDGKGAALLEVFGGILLALTMISYIIYLIGLRQAGKEEPYFKTAFKVSMAALLCSVAGGVLSVLKIETARSIAELAVELLQILIIVYVIYGIVSLAGKLEDRKLEQRGKRLLMLVTVLLFISILIPLMGDISSEKAGALVVGAIGIVAAIAVLIAYVIYLLLLARAVKLLRSK